jgi:hypothetical protein
VTHELQRIVNSLSRPQAIAAAPIPLKGRSRRTPLSLWRRPRRPLTTHQAEAITRDQYQRSACGRPARRRRCASDQSCRYHGGRYG